MGTPKKESPTYHKKFGQHRFKVNGFQMLKTPVTFDMYDAFCKASRKKNPKLHAVGEELGCR